MNTTVRRAIESDVIEIHNLLHHYASRGRLLPRPSEDISQNIDRFFVSQQDRNLAGCVSLEVFNNELGEVRSLAVKPTVARSGHGYNLVKQIESEAKVMGLRRLMALTYVPQFFQKLGFKIVPMDSLPEKVFGVCVTCPKFDRCDEIAVLKSQPE